MSRSRGSMTNLPERGQSFKNTKASELAKLVRSGYLKANAVIQRFKVLQTRQSLLIYLRCLVDGVGLIELGPIESRPTARLLTLDTLP